jgi:hypothetical protein
MKKLNLLQLYSILGISLLSLASPAQAQLSDVTQPGDALIPSSANSPGSEVVANAIDNAPTKYLNFDSGRDGTNAGFSPSGFIVTPSIGATHVRGVALQSANDAPNRDPKAFTLEGSNDATIAGFNSGNWELITAVSNITPWTEIYGTGTPDPSRFKWQTFYFNSPKPYKHYRWIVTETQTTPNGCCMQIAEVELLGSLPPPDVTQPGDRIIPSSANSPGSEVVANAIDNAPTKYLNFDSGRDGTNAGFSPSGFLVTPGIGRTLVTGISLQSANDAPNRDPKAFTLEGSNDTNITSFASGNWELITAVSNITPWPTIFGTGTPDPSRFKTQTFMFPNVKPYRHYRWIVTETQTTPNGCCMQIAEVEFLGSSAPQDVTQPGDPIIPSSPNNPGSEVVANAIDNAPTKYLNFDSGRDGTNAGFSPSGFVVTPRIGATTVIGLTMQSANDAPNRDPRAVTLEGSNDDTITGFHSGTWELITAISNITPWTEIFGTGTPDPSRFKTQEFFFDNVKPYKHYRWIVTETQTTPNGCCMQIAEVELLAVPQGCSTNVINTLIARQPEDTPVLLGAQATLRVFPTGPWSVQWFKNGVAIPGATTRTYNTPTATPADDGARFQARVCNSEGTQMSDEVILSIFTPSTIESIGASFVGDGANGTPSPMFPEDITGFHRQAYWNNLPDSSGTAPAIVNSSNEPTAITLSFATSGEWGVGTGEDSPSERMLNGMGTSFSTTEATAQTITFNNVPQGNHSLLVYTVQVPLEFFNMDFIAVTHDAGGADVIQRRFIRPQNSDEYNPSPGFVLVTSETAANRSVGNFIRFDNLQPGPDGFLQLRFYSPGRVRPPGTEDIRGPGVNGFQLLLNPGPVPNPPVVSQDPVGENAPVGGTVVLRVQATGDNLAYQWLKSGQVIPGETGPTLTLENLQQGDAGKYSVAISNPAGRVISRVAVVDVLQTDAITEDLVVYFKFDEPGFDLGVADNSAPGGVDGEVRGTSFDATFGQVNGAILLNGTDNYVFVPNYAKPTNVMTVLGWIQANAEQAGAIINNWVASQPIGSRGQFQVDLTVNAGVPELRGIIGVGANQPTAVGTASDLITQFNHFALSANGSTLSLYWNGQLVDTVDYIGNINLGSFPWLAIGATFNGDLANPAAANFFNGALDDLAIWRRSLSGAEINAIYNGGLAGQSIDQIPPVSAPFLTIFRQGNDIVVSWSQNVLGYTLESSPTLNNPNWTTVAGVANNRYTATAPTGMRFFRLKKAQ